MKLDSVTRAILSHVKSMGYTYSTIGYPTTGRVAFKAWRTDENPDGVYRIGELYRSEGATAYEAAVHLAKLLGVELEG